MKRVISLFLSIIMLMSVIAGVDLSTYAASNATLDNLEIYKAQCFLGTAEDSISDAVFQCNSLYNFYVSDELFSPSKNYLDLCYSDEKLMRNYNEWKLYSLAASPSSALDKVAKKEDYYESLIISMYSRATAENDEFKKFINNKVIKNTNKFIGTLCDIAKVTNINQLADKLDVNTSAGIDLIKQGVSQNYAPAIVGKLSSNLSEIISASNTIYDLSQRISLYETMAELDDSTKLWINQMYQACSSNEIDTALTMALMNLSLSSTDFSGAVLADITSAAFSLSKWAVKTTIDEGVNALIASNPVVMAVFSGLKAGKTISNIFFNTDDICEQLYLMECIYEVETLSRKVIGSCSDTFLKTQSLSNAQSFIYSVDCYFEAIIDLDIDCMEKFLDKLYNGGIIKGNQNDYNEHISTLEDLRQVRMNNYNNMIGCFKAAVRGNFPEEGEEYFGNTVLLQNIEFSCGYTIRPNYPDGYADVLVDETVGVNVIYYPSDTTQTGYTLKSSNPDVLRVEDAEVIGVSKGTATLTVTSTVNPNVFYSKEIKVAKRLDGEQETPAECFTYTIKNNTATITGLVDGYNPTKLIIPSTINRYKVTSIGNYAFYDCDRLTNVTIPDSVTTIGADAFSDCDSLTSVDLGKGVENIGNDAFYYCNSLTRITIPNSVTSIGYDAFFNCTSLISITVDARNQYYSSQDGALFNKNKTELIQYPVGKERTSYTIPNSVTSIGDCAFADCDSLISITIPNSVTSIGDYAFADCDSLTSITIPNSVISISNFAFFNCDRLASITIPNRVTSIGVGAFAHCDNLTSITIPDSVTSIDGDAFYSCDSLTSITIYNRKCEIYESKYTISDTATIYGYNGSTAQAYAEKYGRKFVEIVECTTHKWDSGKVTKAATCTSTGIKTYTCTVCKATKTETIPKTAHKYDSGKVTKSATCTSTGVKTYTCLSCGEIKTETIAKKAHSYKNYITKATTSKNGSIVNKCSVCGTKKSTSTIYKIKSVALSTTATYYNGKIKTPGVTVKDTKGKTLKKGTDYTVSYASGRKNVGRYAVKVTFKNNYSGSKTLYFNIIPKNVSGIKKLTAGKKRFTVSWNPQKTQVTGYQIQYSTASNFKNAKTITMGKSSYSAKKVTRRMAKKRYYVRIRTYKTVKFNGKNYNIYSPWCAKKSVVTKK